VTVRIRQLSPGGVSSRPRTKISHGPDRLVRESAVPDTARPYLGVTSPHALTWWPPSLGQGALVSKINVAESRSRQACQTMLMDMDDLACTVNEDRPCPLGISDNATEDLRINEEIEATIAAFVNGRERSVVVSSLRGRLRFSIEAYADVQRPAASILKLPLAMTLWDMAGAGEISLSTVVRKRVLPQSRYPSIINVFDVNHSFLLREICGLMLSTSDNPCSQYIINRVGTDRVNRFLQGQQCNDSLMVTGYSDYELVSPLARSNYTTANDVAKLLATAYRQERFCLLLEFLKQGIRKFRLPHLLPEDLPIANKTGSLSGVVNDAAIIYGDQYDLLIVVLTDAEDDDLSTSSQMGNLVETIWEILGERLEEI
jgi:beta-lactamase class A